MSFPATSSADAQPRSIQCSPSPNPHRQDEEAELLAELERIKKERAAEAARKATEEAASAEASAKDELIRGNPLILGGAASFQARVMSRLPSSWLKPL